MIIERAEELKGWPLRERQTHNSADPIHLAAQPTNLFEILPFLNHHHHQHLRACVCVYQQQKKSKLLFIFTLLAEEQVEFDDEQEEDGQK